MFYPEKMSFVTIASSRDGLEPVIETLYGMKLLQIDEYVPQEGIPLGSPLKGAEKVSDLLLDLHFIRSLAPWGPGRVEGIGLKEADQLIRKLKREVLGIKERREAVGQKLRESGKRQEGLEFLEAAGVQNAAALQSESLGVLAGFSESPANTEALLKGRDCIMFWSKKLGKQYPVVVACPKAELDSFRPLMGLVPHALEGVESRDVGRDLQALKGLIEKLRKEDESLGKALRELGTEHGPVLRGAERLLRARIRKAEAPLKCAVAEHSFLIAGWVPSRRILSLRKGMERFRNLSLTVEEAEEGPTKLANPRGVKSFEFFLNLYSLPRLREIDPTFVVFLSFPIFYGMMLGDIGYGLVLYLLFSVLRWKLPKYRGLFDIFLLSSLSTMVFGYVFGEFFGAEEIMGIPLHPFISRVHDVQELMFVSLMFGLVHLNLGFAFGFLNEFREHGLKKAVLTKASWVLLEFSGIFLVMDFFFGMPVIDRLLGGALALAAIGMLFRGEGLVGLIEIPGLISSVLSYLRLAAVGLASASLALVANRMAGDLFASGGFLVVAGVLVLVLGHAMNIGIGLIDAFLQSLRLHYVEMFTKFYRGSGKPYNPFGR